MRAALHDPALVENDDPIRAFHRGQPVCNHQRRAALHQDAEFVLHAPLRLVVERRGGLIQDENGRILEQRACDGYPLPLSAGKILPAVRQGGIESLRLLRHELQDVGRARRGFHFRLRFVDGIEGDVVAYGVVEQNHILTDEAHLSTQVRQPILAHVDPVQQHRTLLHVVEPRHQTDQRRLAAAGSSDDGHGFAGTHVETDLVQHVALVARVGERHIAKFDVAAGARQLKGTAAAFGGVIHDLEHALARGDALLQGSAHVDQAAQRRRNEHQRSQETEELIDLHVVGEYLPDRHV